MDYNKPSDIDVDNIADIEEIADIDLDIDDIEDIDMDIDDEDGAV